MLNNCSFYPHSELHLLPFLQPSQARASNQAVSATHKEGKSCIEGAKYAVSNYLPPPSKMIGVTFHFLYKTVRE